MFSAALLIASVRNSHLLTVYARLSATYAISAAFNATTRLYRPFLSGFIVPAYLMLIFIRLYFARFATTKLMIVPKFYSHLALF